MIAGLLNICFLKTDLIPSAAIGKKLAFTLILQPEFNITAAPNKR
jgi:hypothetical protein